MVDVTIMRDLATRVTPAPWLVIVHTPDERVIHAQAECDARLCRAGIESLPDEQVHRIVYGQSHGTG